MNPRARNLAIAVLFVTSVAVGWLVWTRSTPASEQAWAEYEQQDQLELVKTLHYAPADAYPPEAVADPPQALLAGVGFPFPSVLELSPEFWEQWDQGRARYGPERLARLRAHLHTYLDFVESEWEDSMAIYESGDADTLSQAARANRERLRAAFGEAAAAFIEEGKLLRQDAFEASPMVAGEDPDRPYRVWAPNVRDWLAPGGPARRRVEELTTPLE